MTHDTAKINQQGTKQYRLGADYLINSMTGLASEPQLRYEVLAMCEAWEVGVCSEWLETLTTGAIQPLISTGHLAHTKIQDVSKFVAAEINSFLPP